MRAAYCGCGLWALLTACATGTDSGALEQEAGVEIGVTALVLPDATDVKYTITVYNDLDAVVWTETSISSNEYGFGSGSGSMTYFGPCDSDDNDSDLTSGEGRIDVSIDELTGLTTDEWVNPGIVSKAFTCVENDTTRVDFDVTVAVDGNQGFSDITVDFDDIYCSASITCDTEGIRGPADVRIPTATVNLSCTASEDPITNATPDTVLYMNDLVLTCSGGDGDATLDPAPASDGINLTSDGAALSHLVARRTLNGIDAETSFWQIAVGLDTTKTCTLTTRATATNGPLAAMTTPADETYPVIDYTVAVTDGSGTIACSSHLLSDTENTGDVHVQFVGDGDADGSFPGETFENIYDSP